MTEILHCPGAESINWKDSAIPVDEGTVDVEVKDILGVKTALCPSYENGTCVRPKQLWPDADIPRYSSCALAPYGRSMYPELLQIALSVEPDSNKLEAIKTVKHASEAAAGIQEAGQVPLVEAYSSYAPETVSQATTLPEVPPVKLTPEVFEAKTDTYFSPFSKAKEFLTTDEEIAAAYLDEAAEEDLPVLLRQEINFLGVKGVVEVVTDLPDTDDLESYYTDSEMPLGPVRWTMICGDGANAYEVLPVKVRVQFETKSFKKFAALDEHLLELTLGDQQFYLSCTNSDEYDELEKDDFKNLGRNEKIKFSDSILKDEDGDEMSVSLPMDLEKLRTIQMRFIIDPEFEDES